MNKFGEFKDIVRTGDLAALHEWFVANEPDIVEKREYNGKTTYNQLPYGNHIDEIIAITTLLIKEDDVVFWKDHEEDEFVEIIQNWEGSDGVYTINSMQDIVKHLDDDEGLDDINICEACAKSMSCYMQNRQLFCEHTEDPDNFGVSYSNIEDTSDILDHQQGFQKVHQAILALNINDLDVVTYDYTCNSTKTFLRALNGYKIDIGNHLNKILVESNDILLVEYGSELTEQGAKNLEYLLHERARMNRVERITNPIVMTRLQEYAIQENNCIFE